MDLSQRTEFCQQLLYFFENFVSVSEPLIQSWFVVPTTQMPIFLLFVSAGVLFDGAFSLWVSLNVQTLKKQLERTVTDFHKMLTRTTMLVQKFWENKQILCIQRKSQLLIKRCFWYFSFESNFGKSITKYTKIFWGHIFMLIF